MEQNNQSVSIVCNACKIEKLANQYIRKRGKTNITMKLCDDCRNRVRIYHQNNKDKINLRSKKYKKNNKDKIREQKRKYNQLNKETIKQTTRIYNLKNKEKINNRRRLNYKNNINYRVSCNLRSRLLKGLKGIQKSIKTIELLGCSIDFLKKYLESQFEPGMSWENYKYETFHIDHIIPCISFDLTKEEEQRKCFHYTNLMPRWATTNIAIQNNSNQIGNLNKNSKLFV